MKNTFWLYLVVLLSGLAVLAWPEKDHVMYVQFSETHGPSKLDLAGLLIIAMGYAPMVKEVWKKRNRIQEKLGSGLWIFAIALSIISLLLIALALYLGSDILLWISVTVSTLSQGLLIVKAFQAAPKRAVG